MAASSAYLLRSLIVAVPACALAAPGGATAATGCAPAATPIQHVIIIMQENRSFDSYFGTFPGAHGLPKPLPCLLINQSVPADGCVVPFHDPHDINSGGPHNEFGALGDLDDGITTAKMDGFVSQQVSGQ